MVSSVMENQFSSVPDPQEKQYQQQNHPTDIQYINFSLRLSNNTSHAAVNVPSKSASNVLPVDLFNFFNSTSEN